MKKVLYFECYSGISGDMTVASLLDLGANQEKLLNTLESLNMSDEFDIKISRVKKCGIDANDFNVILKHHEEEEHHHHEHRNIEDVFKIIDKLENKEVKELAKKIFNIVAEAESKAHGISINEVHFHEVGAVDSIVDIISTAFCLIDLDINDIVVSPLYEGTGHVHCAHGDMPVPVPAVLNIISKYNLEIKITENDGEQITPTGAAIVAAIKTSSKLPDKYNIKKIGIGAGKRYPDRPSVLRTMIIEFNC